jgi:hypothetical protein
MPRREQSAREAPGHVVEGTLATEPICRRCNPDPDDSTWVTVYPIESKPGRWMVTVDVTMQLCAEHKRRLLEAFGMDDVQEYEPPRHPWLQNKG